MAVSPSRLFRIAVFFPFLLLVAGNTEAQLPSYIPANGLEAWYPFTGNAVDSSGNGNDGTVVGAVLDTDRFGKPNCAYNFDGIDNHITGSSSNFPTGERTVSLWFYTNDLGTDPKGRIFIGYGGGTCGTSWIEVMDNLHNGQNTYEVQEHCEADLIRYYYGTTYPNGAWHNWIITTASSGTNFYIDGALSYASSIFINGTDVQGKIFIFGGEINPDGISYIDKGGDYYVTPFKGKLDDIGIWNRALTPCEIQEVYTGRSAGSLATITANGSTSFCSSGSVLFTANTSDTYQWFLDTTPISGATSQDYTAMQAGNYTVAVNSGSCVDTSDAVTVTINSGGKAGNISSDHDTVCAGSYNTLRVTGASASIQWQQGLAPGTFTDIPGITDTTYSSLFSQTTYFRTIAGSGSCADTSSVFTLVVNSSPSAGTVTVVKDTICETTLASLSLLGSTGTLLQWQHSNTAVAGYSDIAGATSLSYISVPLSQSTYYRVLVSSGSCADTTPAFKVTVIPAPSASFTADINGTRVTFDTTATSGTTTYFWDFDDGTSSTKQSPVHIYDTAGTYHVCLTVKNNSNCNFTLCQNIIINPNAVTNISGQEDRQVYPNPATGSVTITFPGNGAEHWVQIYNAIGMLLKEFEITKSSEINIADLPNGLYFVRVNNDSFQTFKIVKE